MTGDTDMRRAPAAGVTAWTNESTVDPTPV